MNILLSTDNRYVMPTGVLMQSIGMNMAEPVSYHILVDGSFSEESRAMLIAETAKFKSHCSFYVVDYKVTENLPFGKEGMPIHVSIATYYRLFATKILPKNISKILYLDGDLLVRKSLSSLWNTDLTGFAIGAVHDMDEYVHCHSSRLPYSALKGYFNAGVLLINLDYWRENNVLDIFSSILQTQSGLIRYHDQDVLNFAFIDVVKWLPITYNLQNGYLLASPHKRYDPRYQKEIDMCKMDPTIVHFTMDNKPWNIACFHPYRDLWRTYQHQTIWKDYRYDEPKPKKWIHYIRNFLFRYTPYVPKYDRTEYESLF